MQTYRCEHGWVDPLDRPDQRLALIGAFACWVSAVSLATAVRWDKRPFGIDRAALRLVNHRLLDIPIVPYSLASTLVGLGNTIAFFIVLGALFVTSMLAHDRFVACLSIAPPLALVITENIAKPAVGRYGGHVYAFPSGHATAISAVAIQGAVLCYRRWGRRWTVPIGLGLGLMTAAAVLAIVRTQIHLLSDAVAGVLVGFGTVLGVSALLSEILIRAHARRIRAWPE
jgi:membrane-associated phospholipid phosphatase